jgi:hypothetical protein
VVGWDREKRTEAITYEPMPNSSPRKRKAYEELRQKKLLID